MNLKAYLSREDISVADFATLLDVTPAAVHRYLTGDRKPREIIMLRIAKITKDNVQPGDWFQYTPEIVSA